MKEQYFDYFLVLDFEATCQEEGLPKPHQEIIEWPCLKLNSRTLEVESEFHQYVQPHFCPLLSKFCTELTGITQEMVDDGPDFVKVATSFTEWMIKEDLHSTDESTPAKYTFGFVTCGDWDLKSMLPRQCHSRHFTFPRYATQWINIKHSYSQITGKHKPGGMMRMLSSLGIRHTGRHHSGIDDCRNIAKIVVSLIRDHPDTLLTLTSIKPPPQHLKTNHRRKEKSVNK